MAPLLSPGSFPFVLFLCFIMIFLTYYPGCMKEIHLIFSIWPPSCGQWGNQKPFWECCIRAGKTQASLPWPSLGSSVPRLMLCDHAASSSEVCYIHIFRNQLDEREWALESFGASIRACHLWLALEHAGERDRPGQNGLLCLTSLGRRGPKELGC